MAVIGSDGRGLRDREMREADLNSGCTICIMNMQGEPKIIQANQNYENCSQEISEN